MQMKYLQMAKCIEEGKAPMHSRLPHLFWQSQEPIPWHGQHNAHDYPQVHLCLCQKQNTTLIAQFWIQLHWAW